MKLSTGIALCALALAPAFAAQERSAPSSGGAQTLRPTTADSDSGPEVQAVLARTDELNQAFVHSDVATLDRIIADECLQIVQNGARTKAEWLAPYRSGASRFESIKPPEWRRVRLYGDVAVVTSAAEIVMVVQGERRPSRFFNTRTWAKRSGQWYVVLAQNTPRPEETGAQVTTANANENLGQTSSAPATPNDAENTIRELDKQATKALLEGNIEAISKLWADDFVGIGPTGRTRTKAELIEGHRQRLLKLESTEAIEPPQIRMYNNDTALVMIHARSKGKSGDRDTSGEYRGLWVWAKRNENWQIVSYQSSLVPPGLGATEKDARSESADKAGNAEQEVRHVERALAEALGQGQIAAVERIYSDDYTLTTADGELQNKAQRIATLKATDPKSVNRSRDEITVRIYGNTAVVTGHTLFSTQAQGIPNSENRRFTHVFVKRQGSWQLVSAQVTRIQKSISPSPQEAQAAKPASPNLSPSTESGPRLTGTQPDARKNTIDGGTDARKEIVALDEEFEHYRRRDQAGEQILADDYVGVTVYGRLLDKRGTIELFTSHRVRTNSLEVSDRDVRIYGGTAVVIVTRHLNDDIAGNPRQERHRCTKVWVKRDGKWQVVSFQATKIAVSQ